MATGKAIYFRPTEDPTRGLYDISVLDALRKLYPVKAPDIIRIALQRLAIADGAWSPPESTNEAAHG